MEKKKVKKYFDELLNNYKTGPSIDEFLKVISEEKDDHMARCIIKCTRAMLRASQKWQGFLTTVLFWTEEPPMPLKLRWFLLGGRRPSFG